MNPTDEIASRRAPPRRTPIGSRRSFQRHARQKWVTAMSTP